MFASRNKTYLTLYRNQSFFGNNLFVMCLKTLKSKLVTQPKLTPITKAKGD